MPFCTKCGAEVQGRFCVKCGAPAAAPAAPAPAAPPPAVRPPAAMSPPAGMSAPPAMPVKKRTSPLVWILVALVTVFVLIGVSVIAAGFFLVHKAKQAGLDPDLMRKNPGLAVTKMLAAVNPDIEVVRIDEGKGLITLMEKKTGKRTTVDFEAVKQGRISFKDDKGEAVTFESKGSGDSGSFQIKSSTGETFTAGAGADVQVPNWIPTYPGAKPEGKYTRHGADGDAGAFGFSTKDPVKNVLAFYSQGLKAAGLNITSQFTQEAGDSPGGMISAEGASKSRTVVVTVGTESGGTSVAVTYSIKK